MSFRIVFFTLFFFRGLLFGQPLNDHVIKEAMKYEGGSYVWKGSGCPVDLVMGETVLFPKSPVGSFCSGYTFTVLFNTLKSNNLHEKLSVDEWKKFQQHWYGNTSIAAETQCLYALSQIGMGEEIAHEDAKAGDFVQFWRNNKTGHSVIFLAWVRDSKGKIVGMRYRSSQKFTNGIGERTETIGLGEKELNRNRIYIVRLKAEI